VVRARPASAASIEELMRLKRVCKAWKLAQELAAADEGWLALW